MRKKITISIFICVIACVAIIGGIYSIKKLSKVPAQNQEKPLQDQNDSFKIETAVRDYIKKNISTLSPVEAVLGGKFYVTSISFTGPDSCAVNYEDGHISLTANASFKINSSGSVEISSFKVVEDPKDQKTDFSKSGNIVQREGEWWLTYEEPGRPALTIKLTFNGQSLCDGKPCFPVYWVNGARAEIRGIKDKENLLVSTVKIIAESNYETTNVPQPSIANFAECVNAGYEVVHPECPNCKPYCETPQGVKFEKDIENVGGLNNNAFCQNDCGNGACEEVVCMAQGCPCAETPESCPQDCKNNK